MNKLYEKVCARPKEEWEKQVAPWREEMLAWKTAQPLRYDTGLDQIMPQDVITTISNLSQGQAVIVTDVGQHQMWTAQYYRFQQPRSLLTSGGLGTMGYGLPAAMGAKVALPEKQVICICGDGGFMMNCQELMTIADLNLPVKIIIINNQCLGMVAQWQRKFLSAALFSFQFKDQSGFCEDFGSNGSSGLQTGKQARYGAGDR